MTTIEHDETDDGGDISSGFGESQPREHVSDEKGEEMLRRSKSGQSQPDSGSGAASASHVPGEGNAYAVDPAGTALTEQDVATNEQDLLAE